MADHSGDGGGRRVLDLYGDTAKCRRALPVDLTPDEARALVDEVFRSHGLDPFKATDKYGWRHLSLGSVHGHVGVVEWQPEEHHLVVLAPILEVNAPPEFAEFYRLLLELNHDETMDARFSLHDGIVFVSLSRPIRGLNEEEVDYAIRAVMAVADAYDDRLRDSLNLLRGTDPLSWAELPIIKLTPHDAHGQDIFRYPTERWDKAGYRVSHRLHVIGLEITVRPKQYGLAASGLILLSCL